MKTVKKIIKNVIALGLSLVMAAGLILIIPAEVQAANGNTGSSDLQIDYHTKEEIAQYIKDHPADNAYKNKFDVNPSTAAPYSLGKVSDDTLNDACTLLNTFRYLAGIPANVTLKSEYNEYAQAASVVNAANSSISHFPSQPAGMDDAMYQKGYKGAGSSNIAYGYASWSTDVYNLGSFISTGWMSDAGSGNIDRVGHRRWILNPTMSQTGFGVAINGENEVHSAMYAFDTGNTSAKNYKGVVWPAQNVPVGYFDSKDPWSISLGESVKSATVTMKCINTGEIWTFSGTSDCNKNDDTGYININNGGFGQKGCIIFRPKNGVTVQKDYSYDVVISYETSSKSSTINYTVDFFDIKDYDKKPEPTPEQKAQVRAFVNRLYQTTLGRDGEEAGLTYWTDNLLAGNFTGASAAQEFILSEEFLKKDLSYNEFLDICYAAFFDRPGDEEGYEYWLNVMYNGGTREYVVACFVDSEEFTGICKSYGIVRGSLDQSKGKPSTETIQPLKVDSSNVDYDQLYAYVEKLYTTILNRPSEPAGCEYWVQAIKKGDETDAAKAASQFFQSKEYKDKKKTDEEFLVDVYEMFFGRSPDQEGYEYWLDNLKNGKVSRVWLIEAGFGKSDEFKGILESYGFVIQ